jgi:hypothetical protein
VPQGSYVEGGVVRRRCAQVRYEHRSDATLSCAQARAATKG